MHIDFKVTNWERINLDNVSNKDDIIEAIKSGKCMSSDDIFDLFETNDLRCHNIFDTDNEQLHPRNNDNEPTIELYENDEFKYSWSNEIKES